MRRALIFLTLVNLATSVLMSNVFAGDPGLDLPNDPSLKSGSLVNDQSKGSVLIYNAYSSSPKAVNASDTRISITNTNGLIKIDVHMFFVDGSTCSVSDLYLSLTPNQTSTFLISDVDPGVVGYVLAIAVNSDGIPMGFDWLIGDEFVKFESGHSANLGAEAISVPAPFLLAFPIENGSAAMLLFDGVCYNSLPRVLAVSSIASRADGNDSLLIINRIGGDYRTGAGTLNVLNGFLYNDAEIPLSWSGTFISCQLRVSISSNFPRTTPRLDAHIPAGRSGWIKLWASTSTDQSPFGTGEDTRAIVGAILNKNSNVKNVTGAFSGGRNLHRLTLNPLTVITVPISPPGQSN
jgi:hypothetical protein